MNKLKDAVRHHKLKNFNKAKNLYEQIIKNDPKNIQAINLYSILLQQNGLLKDAIRVISKAIKINPTNPEILNNKAFFYSKLEKFFLALKYYLRINLLKPDDDKNINNIAITLNKINKENDAIYYFDKAIKINPKEYSYFFNKGNAYLKLLEYKRAIDCYTISISLNASHFKSFHNRAFAYEELLLLDESLRDYEQTIKLSPNFWESYVSKSQIHLLKGEFEIGWALREYRWKIDKYNKLNQILDIKKSWKGESDIKNKKILIPFEQGLGDTIQFCRLIKMLKNLQCEIFVLVQKQLKNLVQTLDEDITVIDEYNLTIDYDYYCPMMSLPLALKIKHNNIPNQIPYLSANNNKIIYWKNLLGKSDRKRIGIAWRGNPLNGNDYKRSYKLKDVYDLFDKKYDWVSLHNVLNTEEEQIISTSNIKNFANAQKDFDDLAALCHCLDLIITIDTSIVHLAGAIGKKTYLLLAYNPDFRWMTKISNSAWYPTVKIFRHDRDSNWRKLIKIALKEI